MTTTSLHPTAIELWGGLKKEIAGVQLLWEVVERVCFKPHGKGLATLAPDVPVLFGLAQTVLMESLLMRLSRLMDPANSGRREGDRPNLSLMRLVACCESVSEDEATVRILWNTSNLKRLRDKYLSHNDLARSLGEPHTLNIPLETADIEAMQGLANSLRDLRRNVHRKLTTGVTYLDESLDLQIQHDVDILSRSLLGGQLFFELLPDHGVLQQAWQEAGHG